MLFTGVDLHKEFVTVCVMNPARKVVSRHRLSCQNEVGIQQMFDRSVCSEWSWR